MEKLDQKTGGASVDIVGQNIEKLKQIFPDVFTEGKVDFDVLREMLGDYIDDRQERYSFTWNGKERAHRIAQTPSTGTLRPCPDESVKWDTTQNLFIEGDNLEVLKLLQKSYHKRIKMIYIDPPYNTGNEFIYPDKFADNLETYLKYTGQLDSEGRQFSVNAEVGGRYHTNWLNMMYPRLKLARNLLCDDGLIFISVDEHEVSNLLKMCDEVFGEENFIENIVWKKSYGGGAKAKYIVGLHEYVLCYAKSLSNLSHIDLPPNPETRKYYTGKDSKFETRGPFRTQPLATTSMDDRPNLQYPIIWEGEEIWPEKQWQWSKERVEKALTNDELIFSKNSGKWSVRYKQYLIDEDGNERSAKLFSLLDGPYTQKGTDEIRQLFGNGKVFTFPKPSELIKHLASITWQNTSSIILDFFAGSSATAHAVLNLNKCDEGKRRFIMVQLPEPCNKDSEAKKAGYENIADVSKERIRRVIKTIEAEQSGENRENKEVLPGMAKKRSHLDLGFKVLKLDSSNIKPWDADFDNLEDSLFNAVENIKPDRGEADVLYELLLKYGLDLAVPIEERKIEGKTVYIIGAGALIVCLAKQINLEVVEGIAALKDELRPEVMRAVFKDDGFADDVVKTNAVQILRQAGIDDVKSL